ncbi:hypothetical protein [Aquabacterium humicola]|uniref:hypothetical protein n=1 Tax=Aquabacterium humicola TaxID=3237377 RepID=UPI0025436EA0|nr:hypothetical protein [Rubrivivax pictus]
MKPSDRLTTLPATVKEVSLLAHFYVLAEDGTTAGGAAGTFSLETGLECTEYVCLPQVIERSQISENESEHVEAYELAERDGFSVVLSLVSKW